MYLKNVSYNFNSVFKKSLSKSDKATKFTRPKAKHPPNYKNQTKLLPSKTKTRHDYTQNNEQPKHPISPS